MKISVIIPVFNSKDYLVKCINSVKIQTTDNWELILIDDGSTDGSGSICDEMSLNDFRIKTYHQENCGPGIARNNGVLVATGDYIVFLDSDDYIDKSYFKLVEEQNNGSDVIFIDVNQVSPNGILIKKELMSNYKKYDKDRLIRAQITGKIPWGGVRKAVKRELLIKNNILFTNHIIGEEALYSFKLLYFANTISFIDKKSLYFYVNHEGSQSKTAINDPWTPIACCLKEYLIENNLYNLYGDTINAFFTVSYIVAIDKIAQSKIELNPIKECINATKKYEMYFDKNYIIDKKNMNIKALILLPIIKLKIFPLIYICSKLKHVIQGGK